MRHGVVSDAMNMIPEEYKLKALEVLNQAEVSEITNMKKKSVRKILAVSVAATMTLALGVAVAAKAFSMNVSQAEPGKDYTKNAAVCAQNTKPEDINTVINFIGKDEVQGVKFKLGYLPNVTTIPGGEFGNPYDWNEEMLQFETGSGSVTVQVYYDSQFGEDGVMFFNNDVYSIDECTIGDYEVYKIHTEYSVEDWYNPEFEQFLEENPDVEEPEVQNDYVYNYVIMYHPDGYVLSIGGSESIETLSKVAENIEIEKTDKVFKKDSVPHNFEAYYGVG